MSIESPVLLDTKNTFRDFLISSVLLAIALLVYCLIFPSTPVLTEVRSFLLYQGWGSNFLDFLIPTGSDYRPLSWSFFAWQHRQFPFNSTVINLIQYLLLGLGAVLGYLHLRQLLGNRMAAFGAGVLWIVSLSAIHSSFWQATQHDKLAFIFVLSALIVSLHAIRLNQPKLIPVFSAVLLVLVIAAESTKPVAFMLPGALIAQVVLFTPEKTRAAYFRAGAVVLIPVVLGFAYTFGYLFKMDQEWQAHATSGDLTNNLLIFMRFVTNVDHDGNVWHSVPLFTVVGLGWVGAIFLWGRSIFTQTFTGRDRSCRNLHVELLVYFCAISLGSIVVLARARHPASFYVLIPMFTFLASIVTLAMASSSGNSKIMRWFSNTLLCVVVLGLLLNVGDNVLGSGHLAQWRVISKNLSEGYGILRSSVNPEEVQSVNFIVQDKPSGSFYFFGKGTRQVIDRDIPAYLFRRPVETEIFGSFGKKPPESTSNDELRAVWSRDLVLLEASLGGVEIYQNSEEPPWPRYYEIGQKLDFRQSGNGIQFLGSGWSHSRHYGTWSDGKVATILMRLSGDSERPLEVSFSGQAFVSEAYPRQEVQLFANGNLVSNWTIGYEEQSVTRRALIPVEIASSKYLELSFHFLNPATPKSITESIDARLLGVLLQEITIDAAGTVREMNHARIPR